MKQIFSKLFAEKIGKSRSATQAWLDELLPLSDTEALQRCTKRLEVLVDDERLTWQDKKDFLLEVETFNHPRLARLATQYINVEGLKVELQNSILDTCYQYCRQVYLCQLKVIEKTATDMGDGLPLFVARILYTVRQMIKWRTFRQAELPPKTWLQSHALLKFAQRKEILTQEVSVFPNHPSTNLAAHFVQTFMLGQLIHNGADKGNIETANRLLTQWLTRAHISNIYTPEQYVFFVDLNEDFPARRMRAFNLEDEARYWELGELETKINKALLLIQQEKMSEGLSAIYADHPKNLTETLHIISTEWSKSNYMRQRRKEPRRKVSKVAKVSLGVPEICDMVLNANRKSSHQQISFYGEHRPLEDRILAHTVMHQTNANLKPFTNDMWAIADESDHGLGLRTNKSNDLDVKSGKLIAVSPQNESGRLVLGQVRSTRPASGNQLRVSVELISRHPAWAQLQLAANNDIFANTQAENQFGDFYPRVMEAGIFSAIYLPLEANITDASSLIMPKSNFVANQPYLISIGGNTVRAVLESPIDAVDDWVRVAMPF